MSIIAVLLCNQINYNTQFDLRHRLKESSPHKMSRCEVFNVFLGLEKLGDASCSSRVKNRQIFYYSWVYRDGKNGWGHKLRTSSKLATNTQKLIERMFHKPRGSAPLKCSSISVPLLGTVMILHSHALPKPTLTSKSGRAAYTLYT